MFIQSKAFSHVLHWPQNCVDGTLNIKNESSSPVSTWLQKFAPTLVNETEQMILANSSLNISVANKNSQERFSLLHFANTSQLKTTYICNKQVFPTTENDGGVQLFKKPFRNNPKILLQNIFSDINKINLELLDFKKQIVTRLQVSLKASESLTYEISTEKTWAYLKVSSTNKFTAFLLTENSAEIAFKNKALKTEVDTNSAYFLVGPRNDDTDTFIVKITDQEMLERARTLIKNPQNEKILFATIQKNHQGFNRNMANPSKTHWSWSVSEVTNFSDFASTSCNGHPQALEDRVDEWTEEIGRICFWSYRIKKELTSDEVSTGQLN